jgi:hypothetical protein
LPNQHHRQEEPTIARHIIAAFVVIDTLMERLGGIAPPRTPLMGRFFGTGYGGVSTVEKRASRFLAVWGYVPIHAPGARHDSLGRIIARARDRVTADAAPLATAASVLALWSFAMAPAPRCGITGGGAAIAPPVGRAAATVRRRLREWRCETARTAGTKRGVTRQALDVTTCFVPLLHWAPAWRSPTASRAARAMDARTLGQRCTVLAIRLIYRGCALPMVWVVLPAPPKGAWRSPWERRCTLIRPGAPTGWTVIVMADRGWYAQWLDRPIQAPGWRPLLRIKAGGTYRAEGAAAFRPPVQTVQQGKAGWRGRAPCLSGPTSRLAGPLRSRGDDDHTAPGLILTDRVPAPADGAWDGLRPIIAGGFKDVNRGGWHGEPTKMTDPARAARLWLGSAVAALWVVRVGGCAEADGPARMIAALPAAPGHPSQRTRPRLLRCFRRGVIVIVTPVITPGTLRAARCIPEPWRKTLDPWAALPSAQQPHQEAAE